MMNDTERLLLAGPMAVCMPRVLHDRNIKNKHECAQDAVKALNAIEPLAEDETCCNFNCNQGRDCPKRKGAV